MDKIRTSCTQCGSNLSAPPGLAGKTVKCPKCEHPIVVPAADAGVMSADVVEAQATADPLANDPLANDPLANDPLASAPLAGAADPLGTSSNPMMSAASPMQVCPHCTSQIPAAASKCRHCGEFVKAKMAATRGEDTEKMGAMDWIAATIFAPIGAIVGFMWLCRNYKKSYMMLAVSVPLSLVMIGTTFGLIMAQSGGLFKKNVEYMASSQPGGYDEFDEYPPDLGEEDRESYDESERGESARSTMMRPPSEDELKDQPLPIQQAMRANVFLEHSSGRSMGSGIIVKIEDNAALILTNRHVIDNSFASSRGRTETPLSRIPPMDVTYVTGTKEAATAVWVAPDSIDLAIVRAHCPSHGVKAANCEDHEPAITQGEKVYAVGNPVGLGWTLNPGNVSALRTRNKVPIIQTDATINPGNSGGGLYNEQGQLIGINSFIIDPDLAQNVGFAIRYEHLWTLNVDDLDL